MAIDTECSSLPKNWKASYAQSENWPFLVQISWLIYRWDGTLVKQENHYISDPDFNTSPESLAIHHISDDMRKEKGTSTKSVLSLLSADLKSYQPIILGHFVELDFHLINAAYYRIGLQDNPLMHLPFFCTMQASAQLPQMSNNRQLRLTDLFRFLFSEEQPFPHNAYYDALAAAKCFFRIKEEIPMTLAYVKQQKPFIQNIQYQRNTKKLGMALFLAVLLVLIFLMFHLFA